MKEGTVEERRPEWERGKGPAVHWVLVCVYSSLFEMYTRMNPSRSLT